MAYRELELTLVSAQDLKNVNLMTRMDVYAVVSVSGDPLTRQCTEPDTYGGRNPCWNATFRFAVPATAPAAAAAAGASLHVLLRAERFLGDRDVGEVVVPLSDVLASGSGSGSAGPQPPQLASYQVRKLHRWEPRGVLNVSYRLGPVVAPVAPVVVVVERRATDEKAAVVSSNAYAAPVGVVPRQPPSHSHRHPSPAAAYPPAPPGRQAAAGRVVAEAEHDEAQNKSPPVVMAYPPVGVPQQASHSHPPTKPDDAYYHQPPRAPPTPPPPPPPTTNAWSSGPGQSGPTHVYMGPHTQIIFSGGAPTTTTAGLPTWTTTTPSPARSIISPTWEKGDGNWAWAAASESMSSVPVISPRSRNEDRWRPSVVSPFSSRSSSSSFSSPSSSPYSSASAHPSPSSSSSAHSSSARSPYSAHPSTTTSSPHPPLRPPAVSDAAEVTHGTSNNNTFRSTSSRGAAVVSSPLPPSSPMAPSHSRGAAVSSPLPSASPMVPSLSRGAAISSPLSSASPLVPKHSASVVPSL